MPRRRFSLRCIASKVGATVTSFEVENSRRSSAFLSIPSAMMVGCWSCVVRKVSVLIQGVGGCECRGREVEKCFCGGCGVHVGNIVASGFTHISSGIFNFLFHIFATQH